MPTNRVKNRLEYGKLDNIGEKSLKWIPYLSGVIMVGSGFYLGAKDCIETDIQNGRGLFSKTLKNPNITDVNLTGSQSSDLLGGKIPNVRAYIPEK